MARVFPVGRRGLEQEVEMLVHPRKVMSVIPRRVAEASGVEVIARRFLVVRDGSRRRRTIGSVEIAVAGRSAVSPVVLGEHGDTAVLGTNTLHDLHLEADFETGQLWERPEPSAFSPSVPEPGPPTLS